MKKIGILSLMFVAMTITSCKKYLDIKPTQTFGDNLAVSTLQGLSTAVTGGFSQMQGGDLYGGGIIANSELLGDYLVPGVNISSDFSLGQLSSHQMNIYNSAAGGMWGSGYQAILTANTVLKYLPNFYKQDSNTCLVLKGECLFIRAAMHFELVRMFAQPSGFTADDSHMGIPIRLTPGTPTTGQNTPRSSVAQVYAQVIADLQAAESLLPNASTSSVYVSKSTADAMLARVYFSQNKWSQAKDYASKVINTAGYSLNDSIAAIYNLLGTQSTPENVFQIINTVNDDPGSGTLHGRFNLNGATIPSYTMNTPFIDILVSAKAVGDLRYAKLYKKSIFQPTFYSCSKYDAIYSNVSIIRLAEMYLTRAECENQLGDDGSARADYNKIRARAGVPLDNSSTGLSLLAAIRAERDLELAMEGDHYFEVKRRKGSFNTFGAGVLAWNAPTMIYPIPQQEVNENKAMVQNAGY